MLNLPEKLAAELNAASRQMNRPLDEFAAELLQRALAVRRFRSAREAILNSLGNDAPKSDDDAIDMLP